MPPPKRPKTGPTNYEQFLSQDELQSIEQCTVQTNGDNNFFSVSRQNSENSSGSEDGEKEGCINKGPPTLLKQAFSKSDQKVPGSVDSDDTPPSISPPVTSADGDVITAEALKSRLVSINSREQESYQAERNGSLSAHSDGSSPIHVGGSPTHLTGSPTRRSDSPIHRGGSPPSQDLPQEERKRLPIFNGRANGISQTHHKLVEDLIMKTIRSSVAQNIIHAPVPRVAAPYTGYYPQYPYGRPVSVMMDSSESEPQDLSKRQENCKNINLNFYGTVEKQSFSPKDYASRDYSRVRDGNYLNAHKHILGLLSSPEAEHFPSPIDIVAEKENHRGPHMTALLHDKMRLAQMESMMQGYDRQREAIERAICKGDDAGPMGTQGSFMPMHPHPMVPGQGSQAPTSTTLELGERGPYPYVSIVGPHIGSAPEMRRLKQEPLTGGPSTNKLCQVCSDNASGFHYGVWSCEGCKAFFKRSIQGPVDYVCPATNTCTIDKHRRKSCQACRLRKCYEVGMNKGSQRKERKSTGGNGSTPKIPKRSRSDSSEDLVNSTSGGSPTPAKHPRRSKTTLILQALSKVEVPNLESFHNHSVPPSKVHLLNSLVRLAERELVYLINWAKNVPGYIDLSLSDQVHLIECCWMELLLLNVAFRSLEHGGKRLVFAPDLVLERQFWSVVGMSEIFEQVSGVSEQMVQHCLHSEEMMLLQATVLVNAEVRRLSSANQLRDIQQSILDAVVDITQKYHPDNLRHVPSILLLLTHIRQASERAISYFQKLIEEGEVVFCELLKEMLGVQSSSPESRKSSTSTEAS